MGRQLMAGRMLSTQSLHGAQSSWSPLGLSLNMIVRKVFVTVGTTRFDKLITTVTSDDTIRELQELGCQQLTLQVGAGAEPLKNDLIYTEWYRYKPSIAEDVSSADLIISHAGAGSCLEALEAKKQLVVVVNEDLMGDHQRELADRLAELGYCTSTTPSELPQTLRKLTPSKEYKPGSADPFTKFIDSTMGFT